MKGDIRWFSDWRNLGLSLLICSYLLAVKHSALSKDTFIRTQIQLQEATQEDDHVIMPAGVSLSKLEAWIGLLLLVVNQILNPAEAQTPATFILNSSL